MILKLHPIKTFLRSSVLIIKGAQKLGPYPPPKKRKKLNWTPCALETVVSVYLWYALQDMKQKFTDTLYRNHQMLMETLSNF